MNDKDLNTALQTAKEIIFTRKVKSDADAITVSLALVEMVRELKKIIENESRRGF